MEWLHTLKLNMLRTICGPENYDVIVLTITFWDQVDRETGKVGEAQRRDPRKGEVDLACPQITEKCVNKVAICAGRHLVNRISIV
jgi:hypothetical protein